jgi:putative hydrolase of the HAD superfamily
VRTLRAAGVTCVLLSNSLGRKPYAGYELESLFDDLVVSGEVGLRKPQPEIYELAASKAGVPPQACVMIDDFEHNAVAARAVGMHAIHHTDVDATLAELEQLFGVTLA